MVRLGVHPLQQRDNEGAEIAVDGQNNLLSDFFGRLSCVSACNFDPQTGVIGVQN